MERKKGPRRETPTVHVNMRPRRERRPAQPPTLGALLKAVLEEQPEGFRHTRFVANGLVTSVTRERTKNPTVPTMEKFLSLVESVPPTPAANALFDRIIASLPQDKREAALVRKAEREAAAAAEEKKVIRRGNKRRG